MAHNSIVVTSLSLCIRVQDFHGYSPLHYACMWGWTPICVSLIAGGADINDTLVNGRTPLMVAVEFENDLTVKYLLTKPGLHVNATDADGNTALIIAAELNEYGIEMARMLLQKKADPNSENRKKKSPLTIACKAQNMELVHMLLDNQVYICCRKCREPPHKCIYVCAVIIGATKRICICPSAG